MSEKNTKALPFEVQESLIWEQGLRLFAMTNLSEDNPFRPMIEEQTIRDVEGIKQNLVKNGE